MQCRSNMFLLFVFSQIPALATMANVVSYQSDLLISCLTCWLVMCCASLLGLGYSCCQIRQSCAKPRCLFQWGCFYSEWDVKRRDPSWLRLIHDTTTTDVSWQIQNVLLSVFQLFCSIQGGKLLTRLAYKCYETNIFINCLGLFNATNVF